MMAIELSELEMRILSVLDEAGEEDVLTTLNTVSDLVGSREELENYQKSLRTLIEKALVKLDLDSMPTGPIALTTNEVATEIDKLSRNVVFVAQGEHWTDIREKGPPYFQILLPRLVVTETGDALAFKILEERGYQWWRNKG